MVAEHELLWMGMEVDLLRDVGHLEPGMVSLIRLSAVVVALRLVGSRT